MAALCKKKVNIIKNNKYGGMVKESPFSDYFTSFLLQNYP